MAHWNPYYGVPSRNSTGYEEQNSNPNFYYNNQYQYSSVPVQQLDYNNYYNPNNYLLNYNLALSLQGVENQQVNYNYFVPPNAQSDYNTPAQSNVSTDAKESHMPKKIEGNACGNSSNNSNNSNSNGNSNSTRNETANTQKEKSVSSSKLTATAAEFKPGTSGNSKVNTQTFYRNNGSDKYVNKGAIKKTDKYSKRDESAGNENGSGSNNFPQEKPYFSNNQRYYNRNGGHGNDKQKNLNKYDRGHPRNGKWDENSKENDKVNNGTFYSSSFKARYNKYDNNNKNYKDYNESKRLDYNNSAVSYRQDNRNNYRSNYRYDKTNENWRSSALRDPSSDEKPSPEGGEPRSRPPDRAKERNSKTHKYEDDISQRDRLIEQVNRGSLECLVCCERVRQAERTWSCQKCFHIFHLKCIIKWGSTSKDDNGWRCPACQHVCLDVPSNYYCYCGKQTDPPHTLSNTAHSCGEMCAKLGSQQNCVHACTLLCHPGPCPKCEASVTRGCNCGATKQVVRCSTDAVLVCSAICNKILNCGFHACHKKCHPNDCETCAETIEQVCFCSKSERKIPCSADQINVKNYSCNEICDKMLSCGNHRCTEPCHPGDCPGCVLAPGTVRSCPCGKTELEVERTSCLDPVPCCDKVCGKRYFCGQPSNPHLCKSECHSGDCPVCPLSSFVRCRCGHMSCEIPCAELNSRADDARCEKKCTRKRSCGKHKCNQRCCIDLDHICPLPCNRMLSCGLHRCEKTCHNGHCQPCTRIGFDELYCECGAMVIYPPIPCGTKRPFCSQPCTRAHGCNHETLHTCHNQPECPPCTVLTTRWCHGKHEKRTTLPCYQKCFSCGLPCGKELACGRHKCQLACHPGECLKEGQKCTQPCVVVREICGHPCGLPCHEPPCSESQCKETVKVSCECGLRTSTRSCVDMAGEYQRIATSLLASKMADVQRGMTIEIGEVMNPTVRKQAQKTLDCNEECRLVERNRRLAIGLQIRNPDLSAKLTPRYSDFMRGWAKKDPRFCQNVHDKLTELVQLAKQSKQKSRSYSFESMNKDKRNFVHEYCEHFGCESAAYDKEPNRNVVATAQRDKAWLPSVSVLELLQRENGQRKVPGPILNRPLGTSTRVNDSVSLKISASKQSSIPSTSSVALLAQKPLEGETIDYFDYVPIKR